MDKDFDFAISGAGIVGGVLALGLCQSGFNVALFDPRLSQKMENTFSGRAFALSMPSRALLTRLGLWQELEAHVEPITSMQITQGQVGQPAQAAIDLRAAEKGQDALAYMIEERDLLGAVRNALEKASVALHPSAIESFEARAQNVELSVHSGPITAQHLVLAEGRKSQNAKAAGFAPQIYDYDQMGIVCALKTERPHAGVAYQNFFAGGPFAVLPLRERKVSLVWSEKTELAQEAIGLDRDGFMGAIRTRMGDVLGELDLITTPKGFPLYLAAPLELNRGRISAIGDCAHQVHPLAGQGLNIGLKDAESFMNTALESRRLGLGVGAGVLFDNWSNDRVGQIGNMAHGLSGLNFLYSNENALLRHVRKLGMSIFQNNKKLRQWAMAMV